MIYKYYTMITNILNISLYTLLELAVVAICVIIAYAVVTGYLAGLYNTKRTIIVLVCTLGSGAGLLYDVVAPLFEQEGTPEPVIKEPPPPSVTYDDVIDGLNDAGEALDEVIDIVQDLPDNVIKAVKFIISVVTLYLLWRIYNLTGASGLAWSLLAGAGVGLGIMATGGTASAGMVAGGASVVASAIIAGIGWLEILALGAFGVCVASCAWLYWAPPAVIALSWCTSKLATVWILGFEVYVKTISSYAIWGAIGGGLTSLITANVALVKNGLISRKTALFN